MCSLLSALFLTVARTAPIEPTDTFDLHFPYSTIFTPVQPPTADNLNPLFSFSPSTELTPGQPVIANNPNPPFPFSISTPLASAQLGLVDPDVPSSDLDDNRQPEAIGSETLISQAASSNPGLPKVCTSDNLYQPGQDTTSPISMSCDPQCNVCYGSGKCKAAVICPGGGTQTAARFRMCDTGLGKCYLWEPEPTVGNANAIYEAKTFFNLIGNFWPSTL